MRVLHILNELLPSGAETMLRSAGPFWRGQGIDGAILSTGEQPGDYAPLLAAAGYTIHHIPFRRSPAFFAAFFRLLRQNRFDRIHIHCERANVWYALVAYLAGHRGLLRSVHGLFTFTGRLRASRRLERWILRRLLGVRTIAASPSVSRVEWERFGNPAEPVLNWFDDRRIAPTSPELRESARRRFDIPAAAAVILTIGNCAPIKNHRAMLEALARLPDALNLIYLHVGREEPEAGDRAHARALGLSTRVRFCGPLDDITPALAAADLFVMPSLQEALGVAAVEAMAAGLPVILSDIEGLGDLRAIAPEVLSASPNPAALAEAIETLLRLDPAARASLGLTLSGRVRSACSIETGAGRYADLYREVTPA